MAGTILLALLVCPVPDGALSQPPLQRVAAAAVAQATNAATAVPANEVKTVETHLADARANLAAALALGDGGATNVPAGVAAQDVWVRRALLQRVVRVYEQRISNLAELETATGLMRLCWSPVQPRPQPCARGSWSRVAAPRCHEHPPKTSSRKSISVDRKHEISYHSATQKHDSLD
jgi:hypothetical protein